MKTPILVPWAAFALSVATMPVMGTDCGDPDVEDCPAYVTRDVLEARRTGSDSDDKRRGERGDGENGLENPDDRSPCEDSFAPKED